MQTLTLGSFYLGLLLLQVAPVGGEQCSHLVARSTPVSHRREPKTLVFSKRVFTFLLFACLLSGKKTSPDQDGENPLLHPLQPGLGDRTRAHLAPFQLRVLTLAVLSLSLYLICLPYTEGYPPHAPMFTLKLPRLERQHLLSSSTPCGACLCTKNIRNPFAW